MKLIDGKQIAATILEEIAEEVAKLGETKPAVTFIRVGEDPASVSYVRNKERAAAKTGILSELKVFPESITQEELLAEVELLNNDPKIHGILVQAPLPNHIDEGTIFRGSAGERRGRLPYR